jgi:hypothetical protein
MKIDLTMAAGLLAAGLTLAALAAGLFSSKILGHDAGLISLNPALMQG